MASTRIMRALVAVALSSVCASAIQPAKIAPDLLGATGKVDVVVQYVRQPGLLDLQNLLNLGGLLQTTLSLINAVEYLLPVTSLGPISDDPNVVYISPNRPVKARLDFANPAVTANLAARAGYTGSGVRVAVIDSGINSAADLNGTGLLGLSVSRVVYSQSFVPGEALITNDRFGHGTHVAGIIAGNGQRSSSGPVAFRGMGSG